MIIINYILNFYSWFLFLKVFNTDNMFLNIKTTINKMSDANVNKKPDDLRQFRYTPKSQYI